MKENIANSLAIGLLTDTNSLSRGVEKKDLLNYYYLFNKIDNEYVNYIVRNKISVKDLDYYLEAIRSLEIFEEIGLIVIDKVPNRNIVGIIGDFFISLKELSVIIMVNRLEKGTYISIRSETDTFKASSLVTYIIKDIGQGGGHSYMAAGFTEKELKYEFFRGIIKDIKKNFNN
jgi:nanoRNase/pAp phosphatase (c-di-AMP/oligoRNAs hydrolase)